LVPLLGKLAKEFDRLNIVTALVSSACVIKRARRGKTTGTEKKKDGEQQAVEEGPALSFRSSGSLPGISKYAPSLS
jgi:hypothetical protein